MEQANQRLVNRPSQNARDIVLDLFVEETLGSINHELDDWPVGARLYPS